MLELDLFHLARNLAVSSAMVALTVVIHFLGLAGLLAALRNQRHNIGARTSFVHHGAFVVAIVLGLFAVHSLEIWCYAVLYRALGAMSDFETALYFSTVSYASLGYGDILLPREWRLVGAIEGANGIILLGWSTAFFVSVVARIRALEHDWLSGDD